MEEHTRCPSPDADLGEILRFALTYDGYWRLSTGPEHLRPVIGPVLDSMDAGKGIPEWAGLDLLRGTLFFIQRMTHHWGDVPPEQETQMRSLVDAIGRLARDRPLVADDFA